jgi:hypothetical protein
MKNFHNPFRAGLLLVVMATVMATVQQARAVPTTFNIFLDEGSNGSIDWTGTYTIDAGVVTAFSANIGTCSDPVNCLFFRMRAHPPSSIPAISTRLATT